MKYKGFTLFETLISIAIFGIVTMLMFQISIRFFKSLTVSSSKQHANSKFIKAYKYIHKDLSLTDSRYVYTYKIYLNDIPTRWMFFPIPTDKNGLMKGEGNKFSWQRICFYYLKYTNSSCGECKNKKYSVSKESLLKDEKYRYCSDKNLIRLVYDYIGYNDNYYLSEALSTISDNINSYTLPFENNSFPSNFECNIKGYNKIPIIKFVEKKVIAKDIMDMEITTNLHYVNINMSTVKKEDIKKEVKYGTTDFTLDKYSKFVEKTQFIVNTKNG